MMAAIATVVPLHFEPPGAVGVLVSLLALLVVLWLVHPGRNSRK